MDAFIQQIVSQCAGTGHFTAIIGLIGVIIGSVISAVGTIVAHCLKERARAKRDEPRKRLLIQMLEDERFHDRWRKLDTLMHVIGCDEATTKRLLLEIGARGSENRQEVWGLIKYHPFEKMN